MDRAVVALVTDAFWLQGDQVARSNRMPDVPRLRLPHPVAGTGAAAMAELATRLAPRIAGVLRGAASPDNPPVEAAAGPGPVAGSGG